MQNAWKCKQKLCICQQVAHSTLQQLLEQGRSGSTWGTCELSAGGALHSAGVTTNRAEVGAHKKLISSTVQVRQISY